MNSSGFSKIKNIMVSEKILQMIGIDNFFANKVWGK